MTKSEVTATTLRNFYEKDEHKALSPRLRTKTSKILFPNNSTKILHCIFVQVKRKRRSFKALVKSNERNGQRCNISMRITSVRRQLFRAIIFIPLL